MTETAEHMTDTFSALLAEARTLTGMTAAQFDYDLAYPGPGGHSRAHAALTEAAYLLATKHLPPVTPSTPAEELPRRRRLGRELYDRHRPQIDAMIEAAKGKQYTGWSDVSRAEGRQIRYAK